LATVEKTLSQSLSCYHQNDIYSDRFVLVDGLKIRVGSCPRPDAGAGRKETASKALYGEQGLFIK
jgi:hypothetical protein